MAKRASTPPERLAVDYVRRTHLLRGWLAALVAVWVFTWVMLGVEDVKYANYVEEQDPPFTKGQLMPLVIIFTIAGVVTLLPLLGARLSSWPPALASVNRARFGGIAALVSMTGTICAGMLVIVAALFHNCERFVFVESCQSERVTVMSLGATGFLAGIGSLVMAVVFTVRMGRVRRIAVGGPAAGFPRVAAGEPDPRPAAADLASQLSRLSDLRASGQLTEAEFHAAKQRLLDQPGRVDD